MGAVYICKNILKIILNKFLYPLNIIKSKIYIFIFWILKIIQDLINFKISRKMLNNFIIRFFLNKKIKIFLVEFLKFLFMFF